MKHVTDLLQLHVSGELDGPRKEMVEEHLLECPACRAEAGKIRRLWDELGAVETVQVRASAWSAVQARTFAEGGAGREWFFGSGRLVRSTLAATAVAAGLTLGVLMPAGPSPETADETDTSWLSDASWVSNSSWLGGGDAPGIDDLLLGVELPDKVDGS